MSNVLIDALKDSLDLVPFLLAIYIGIAWLEYRFESSIQTYIRKAGRTGPLLGALFGCFPQCGFSVIGSALYARAFITTGTLLAVLISTSDEAVPVIMADPSRLVLVFVLLLTKVCLALLAGYGVDAVTRKKMTLTPHAALTLGSAFNGLSTHSHVIDQDQLHEELSPGDAPIEVDACCGHHLPGVDKRRALLFHPLIHTVQVFLVLFVVSVGINLVLGKGGSHLGSLLGYGSTWQPVITAFVGLIPNCGASVALTEVYLRGGITFGAVISGLSCGAGLGVLVLVRENRSIKDTARIIALLVGISITAGIAIQCIQPHVAVLNDRRFTSSLRSK